MPRPVLFLLTICALALPTCQPARPALAGEVAVIAPLSGPFEELGKQVAAGVKRAFPANDAPVFDDACSEAGGKTAAEQAIASGVRLLAGFLCTEAFQGAVPVLKDKGVTVLSVGIRTESMAKLAERNGIALFRLVPHAKAEMEAVGRLVPPLFKDTNFAIIDDGTIGARDLAEAFRTAATAQGLKPVFNDTFRPQLDNQIALIQRLVKAGATHVFAGGDRGDIAIMARDAAARNVALTFAGGESLDAADDAEPLADGVYMVGLADWSRYSPQTAEIAESMGQAGVEPARSFWRAVAAGEIASALVKEGGDFHAQLKAKTFTTRLGPVKFDADGYWTAEPYALFVLRGGVFVPPAAPVVQ